MRPSRSTATTIAVLTAGLLTAACTGPAPAGTTGSRSAETVDRSALLAATERYRDVDNALADGYIPDPTGMCVTAAMEGQPPELGAMGIHYFRPDLLGITTTSPRVAGSGTHMDFATPGVLIYEPEADGSLELVAIENVVFQSAWRQSNARPPTSYGHEYASMIDDPATPADEAHGFEPHYELHLWLYRENPAGEFMPFNPNVTCAHHATPA